MQLIKNINAELQTTYDKLESAYMETIELLRFTVEAKDTYTEAILIEFLRMQYCLEKP